MTVIAAKGGIMAADTSSWHGDVDRGGAVKIRRLSDGSLFGAAGWRCIIERAAQWAEEGFPDDRRPEPVKEDQLDALILKPDGSIWCMANEFVLWRGSSIETAGAHHEFLYGAMMAGASAETAVRLAIRCCAKAGGDVQVMYRSPTMQAVIDGAERYFVKMAAE